MVFDYPVFDEGNGDGVDVDLNDNVDDTNTENDDDENAENLPSVAHTPTSEGDNHPHFLQLRWTQGVPFRILENIPDSVIRSLIE